MTNIKEDKTMKIMMIDFKDENGKFIRRKIEGCAFSIRDGVCYFTSEDGDYSIDIDQIVQVFMG